ncbi:MAG: hypothetical protein ABEJ34_02515 [Haloferacaceae archaeon]
MTGGDAERATGVTVPDEHVAAFVAEAFEDAERDTDYATVVDRVVAPEARDAWAALSPREQVEELLGVADGYDERALDSLRSIPVDARADADDATVRERYEEALRLRRNADVVRDAVAAAYAEGRIDDDALVAAVESHGFDTETVAAREDRLETVAEVHNLDFRPYGGTLMDAGDPETGEGYDAW